MTEAILGAATGIVARDGVEALSMHRVAAALEVAVGGLYRYFPSREALVVDLQRRAVDALAARVDEALEGVPRRGDERAFALARLVRVARVWREEAAVAPERHLLLDAFLSDRRNWLSDEQARVVDASLAPLLRRVTTLLQEAALAGALSPGDGEQRTHVLWAALHGLDHFRKRDTRVPAQLASEALFLEAVTTLLLGWGAAPTVVSGALRP